MDARVSHKSATFFWAFTAEVRMGMRWGWGRASRSPAPWVPLFNTVPLSLFPFPIKQGKKSRTTCRSNDLQIVVDNRDHVRLVMRSSSPSVTVVASREGIPSAALTQESGISWILSFP